MELSISDIRDLISGQTIPQESPFKIGDCLFIRTVTYHLTGKVIAKCGKFITLEKAAWIADSGRFYNSLKDEKFDEVEPFCNNVIVNTDCIVDATYIKTLPTEQK